MQIIFSATLLTLSSVLEREGYLPWGVVLIVTNEGNSA